MGRISKVLKWGSSKVGVTAQKLFSVSLRAFVPSCETISRVNAAVYDLDLPPEVPRYKIDYAYDHRGRMVWKNISRYDSTAQDWAPEKETGFLWDGWNIITETSAAPIPNSSFLITNFTHYVWGIDLSGSLQGAGGVGGLLAVVRDDGIFYPTCDGNGNIPEYVDNTGAIVAHYEYDAFGNVVAQSGELFDNFTFRFSTKPYCIITGTVHYQRRPYSPSLGRFLPRDPIKEQGGLNLYGFCENESVSRIDRLGLKFIFKQEPTRTDALPDEMPKKPGLITIGHPKVIESRFDYYIGNHRFKKLYSIKDLKTTYTVQILILSNINKDMKFPSGKSVLNHEQDHINSTKDFLQLFDSTASKYENDWQCMPCIEARIEHMNAMWYYYSKLLDLSGAILDKKDYESENEDLQKLAEETKKLREAAHKAQITVAEKCK